MLIDGGEAFELIAAGLGVLGAAGIDPVDSRDAILCVREFEVLTRRMEAAQVALLGSIDERRLFASDGHQRR